jgi:hypothetical protein
LRLALTADPAARLPLPHLVNALEFAAAGRTDWTPPPLAAPGPAPDAETMPPTRRYPIAAPTQVIAADAGPRRPYPDVASEDGPGSEGVPDDGRSPSAGPSGWDNEPDGDRTAYLGDATSGAENAWPRGADGGPTAYLDRPASDAADDRTAYPGGPASDPYPFHGEATHYPAPVYYPGEAAESAEPARPKRRGLVVLMVWLALAAVATLQVWWAASAGVVLLVAARTVGADSDKLRGWREERGVRAGDGARAALGLPITVVRALAGELPGIVIGGGIAWAAYALLVNVAQVGWPVDWIKAGCVLVGLLIAWWVPPGPEKTRRGAHLALSRMLPRWQWAAVAIIVLALVVVLLGWSALPS